MDRDVGTCDIVRNMIHFISIIHIAYVYYIRFVTTRLFILKIRRYTYYFHIQQICKE